MARFNTGNPVDSKDPRDLSDNAQNIDEWSNGSGPSFSDRLGVQRRTIAGMDGEFQSFLDGSAYEFLGDYAADIEVTSRNQVIRDAGEFWRVAASTELPYTTTGLGMPEGGAFVPVGDAVLRQDLAGTDGLDFIGGTGTAATRDVGTSPAQVPDNDAINSRGFAESVASVADLRALSSDSSLENVEIIGGADVNGRFYADRIDTSSPDDGEFVVIDATNVRWKRGVNAGSFMLSVPSLSDLRGSTYPNAVNRIYLEGYTGAGTRGGGGLYADRLDTSSPDNGGTVFVDGGGVRWKILPGFEYGTNFTVDVGGFGDYPTINAAVDAVAKGRPAFRQGGTTATIMLRSGFVVAEQLSVVDIDLSWILIDSVDAEVTVSREAITSSFGFYDSPPTFGAYRGKLPTLAALFNMDSSGTSFAASGIAAVRGGYALVHKGFKNAARNGGEASYGSTLVARPRVSGDPQATFEGAGRRGLTSYSGSNISAQFVNLQNCGGGPDGPNFAAEASHASMLDVRGANANGSETGFRARAGANIDATESTAINCTNYGYDAFAGGDISAFNSDGTGAGIFGYRVTRAGIISRGASSGTVSIATTTLTVDGIIYGG